MQVNKLKKKLRELEEKVSDQEEELDEQAGTELVYFYLDKLLVLPFYQHRNDTKPATREREIRDANRSAEDEPQQGDPV